VSGEFVFAVKKLKEPKKNNEIIRKYFIMALETFP